MDRPNPALDHLHPPLRQAVLRLHLLEQRRRWLLVALLWFVLSPLCLAMLHYPIGLLLEHFTWSGVRYGLAFNPIPATGLVLTLLLTLSSLLSQGVYRLYGIPSTEVYRLEKQVKRIQARGHRHPIWWKVWG